MFIRDTDTGVTTAGPLWWPGMPEAYTELRDLILGMGHEVAPRGEKTFELLGVSFTIDDAVNRGVPVGCGRKVGRKMQAIDGSNNLAGRAYPDLFIRLAPVLDRFADDLPVPGEGSPHITPAILATAGVEPGPGVRFHQGMYGPRIGDQLVRMESQLRDDPSTRQAVASLWREEDRNPFWKDRPCTTEFQLMLRDDGLHMFVFMRANDLWTGTCYDVFQFGQIQAAMAHVLGVEVGPYHHYATSLHIYERDVEKFAEVQPWPTLTEPAVVNERETFGPPWGLLPRGTYKSMREIQHVWRRMLDSIRAGMPWDPMNEVEYWYYEILRDAA